MLLNQASFAKSQQLKSDLSQGRDLQDQIDGIYDNVIKDYVSSVFTESIEDFIGATVKIVGWLLVGSFVILSGALVNVVAGEKRSMPGFGVFDGSNLIDLNNPFVQGVDMVFPFDESIFDCYKERETCTNRDLQGEIGHLISSVTTVKDFAMNWLKLGEQLGHRAMEADYDDIQDVLL